METRCGCEGKRPRGLLLALNRSFRLGGARTCDLPLVGLVSRMQDRGLHSSSAASMAATMRPLEIVAPRIDTYRFSMANLEDTQDADLDAILGELCALDSEYDEEISRVASASKMTNTPNAESSGPAARSGAQTRACNDGASGGASVRTESPDNDSAFSDTVSMLSSESSASSGASAKCKLLKLNLQRQPKDATFQQKTEKIKLALERMREASVKKLFIKAFSMDGSSKSLLVDEKMTCGYVARLLADKNHVTMEPKWAIVEHLPDLHMERVYEDHELLVDNLMLWTRDSKNKIYFAEKPEKNALFQTPEKFLMNDSDRGSANEFDEHSRSVMIEEFFGQASGNGPSGSAPALSGHCVPPMEGPLYLKSDAKKGWKKYHFVLRSSDPLIKNTLDTCIYYFPKEKVKTLKELVCLATFDMNEVYVGVNWRKKYKAPTEFCFAIKHPRLQQPKSVKFIKFLCADDQATLERWIVAMRIAKHGRQLLDNYRSLVDDLTQEDLDHLAHARSCSISSIPINMNGANPIPASIPAAPPPSSSSSGINSDISSGRHSRASSSSSSGCLSDGGTASESAFDCEFPMGTIKRKPSMKPNIPLTSMTRQLKEMVENDTSTCDAGHDNYSNTGTLTRRHSRRKSNQSSASGEDGMGTLKRQNHKNTDDGASLTQRSSSSSSCVTPTVLGTVPNYASIQDRPLSSPSTVSAEGIYEVINIDRQSTLENNYRDPADGLNPHYGYTKIYDTKVSAVIDAGPESIEDFPLPPPPVDINIDPNGADGNMFSSTLSLDSLPPPPPLAETHLEDFNGSQLSLPPPPLPEQFAENTRSNVSEIINQLTQHQAAKPKPAPIVTGSGTSSLRSVNIQQAQQMVQNAWRGPGGTVPRHPSLNSLSSSSSSTSQSSQQQYTPHGIHDSSVQLRNGSHKSLYSPQSAIYSTCLAELQSKKLNNGSPTPIKKTLERNNSKSSECSSPVLKKHVNFADDPVTNTASMKKAKKITFALSPQQSLSEASPSLPRKPAPPKRNETTKLTSPKKLADSTSNPPKDFLKDLQRVMRKKWQVAQKCKLEPTTTPHEVLGFREYPLAEDYKETSVSNWVEEHYGNNAVLTDNLYENIYSTRDEALEHKFGQVRTFVPPEGGIQRGADNRISISKKRPPPAPPKRSETTQLTTTAQNIYN